MPDPAPLTGVKVVDFSTLLPGPFASLCLAEAGADVVKIEPPGGEGMRQVPSAGQKASWTFAVLNRGKRSICADLKDPEVVRGLLDLIDEADILLEQFRPGVMARLGFGYEALRARNPRLIYCSITGYGQTGPKALEAGHDLNFMADTGVLALSAGPEGARVVPPVLSADLAGGSYPAVINILLALLRRHQTGEGCHIDISMSDNLFPLAFWVLAEGWGEGRWPGNGDHFFTGATPRYGLYETSDGGALAAGPIEEKFWARFCDLIGLPKDLRDDRRDPAATRAEITRRIGAEPTEHWQRVFADADCCVCVVRSLKEAVDDPHYRARGLFDQRLALADGTVIPALPVAVVGPLRADQARADVPEPGADTDAILGS